jgi:hypothetical protein
MRARESKECIIAHTFPRMIVAAGSRWRQARGYRVGVRGRGAKHFSARRIRRRRTRLAPEELAAQPEFVAADLFEAVDWILKEVIG